MTALVGATIAVIACLGVWIAVAGFRGVAAPERSAPVIDTTALFGRFGIATAVTLVVWLTTGWPMAGVSAGAIAAMVPVLLNTRRERNEQLERANALASWAEMLRDNIASHAGLNQAVAMTASVAPIPIRSHVRQLGVDAERLPLTTALRRFAADVDDSVADLIVAALIIADQHQAQNLSGLLSDIARSSRQQSSMRLRIETGRARTYASVRSVVIITLGLAVGLVVFSPDYLTPYDGAGGQLVLGFIGLLFVGAVVTLVSISRPAPQPRLLAGVEDTIAS